MKIGEVVELMQCAKCGNTVTKHDQDNGNYVEEGGKYYHDAERCHG